MAVIKGFFSFVSLFMLVLSVFAFSWVLSEEIVSVGAVEKLTKEGDVVEVEKKDDGTYVDSSGNVYVQGEDGRIVLRGDDPVQRSSVSRDSASTALVPTSPQTDFAASPPASGTGDVAPSGGGMGDVMGLLSSAPQFLGMFSDMLKGPLGEALIWGGVVFGGAMAVSSAFGKGPGFVEAVSIAAGAGAFSAKLVQGMFDTGTIMTVAIGAGVGLAVFYFLYEDKKYEAVEFRCLPWQSPVGATSDVCEKCNDPTMPCSEYRCRSLGQTCELVNEGTKEERCVDVNPNDVSPPRITPDSEELTAGYRYDNVLDSPPGPGFDVVRINSDDGCIKAFTPLRIGIKTDEPAQCKIDFNSTDSYEDMFAYMGRSNLFKYEHYEQFVLPNAARMNSSSFPLRNGKDLTFYIRCMDKRGNTNEAEYAVNFCVDPSPDTTAPQIRMTSIESGSCIPATTDSAIVEFYVNEPSLCRWSRDDQSYELMDNDMVCNDKLYQMNSLQLYSCRANLSGVSRELTDFYVRCQDLQHKEENDRNTNQESLRFNLRGSTRLKLKEGIHPNGTVYGGINPMPVTITAETLFGCDKGEASCYFSLHGEDGDYVLFANTDQGDGLHNQTLYLEEGDHEVFVKCVDSGGNMIVESTRFYLDIDTSSPIISRMYNDDGQLKIVTLRDSECSYSFSGCDFMFEEGMSMPKDDSKVHFADWNNKKTYYVKCRDEFRDLTADCSAVIRPIKLFYDED